jgi:1-phosphatidylinositol-4-phosphate 5-kinase
MVKKIETFWKGLSADRTQISSVPPQEYGDRFLKFMSGVTMSPEQAARDEEEREAAAVAVAGEINSQAHEGIKNSISAPPAPNYLPPPPPGMRGPGSPEPNPTVEAAARKALKRDEDVAREDDLPERKLTTTSTTATSGKPTGHTVLPIVEEVGESGSVGDAGRADSAGGSRPYTPNQPDSSISNRPDGFTDLGPHGIGGRGPPTPPKSSYVDVGAVEENRKRGGSGSSGNLGTGVANKVSRDSLDKALPPIPPNSN